MSRTHILEPLEQRKLLSASLGTDPTPPNLTALFIEGTAGDDQIVLSPIEPTGQIEVTINGVSEGIFANVSRYYIRGLSGDDDIRINPTFNPGTIYFSGEITGDAGNDRIRGAAGHEIIWGGDGDDLLLGGAGNDMLLGGRGADTIVGNGGEDVLLSGFFDLEGSVHEHNTRQSVRVNMSSWNPGISLPLYIRAEAVLYGWNGGIETWEAMAFTVFRDDGVVDHMIGGAGQDFFLPKPLDLITLTPDDLVYYF